MKNNIFKYLSVLLAAVAISLYTCSDNSYQRLLDENKAIIEQKNEMIDQALVYRDSVIKVYEDSIQALELQHNNLEKELAITRSKNSIKITKAKQLTKTEADSVVTERFVDNNGVVIFAAKCDSLFDDHISLQERYENRVNELTVFAKLSKEKDEKIALKDEKIDLAAQENTLLKSEVNEERKKGNKKFVKGIIVGGIAVFVASLFL